MTTVEKMGRGELTVTVNTLNSAVHEPWLFGSVHNTTSGLGYHVDMLEGMLYFYAKPVRKVATLDRGFKLFELVCARDESEAVARYNNYVAFCAGSLRVDGVNVSLYVPDVSFSTVRYEEVIYQDDTQQQTLIASMKADVIAEYKRFVERMYQRYEIAVNTARIMDLKGA